MVPTATSLRIGARVRAERKSRGLVVLDLAEQMKEAAPERVRRRLPSSRDLERTIRAHESGKRGIGPRYRILYARTFGIDEDELFPEFVPPPPTVEDEDPATAKTGDHTPDEGDEVKRRAALQFLAALSAGAAVPPGALETILSGLDDALGRPVDLTEWEAIVREYGSQIAFRPSGALVGDLTSEIITVGELLKRHQATDDVPGLLRVRAGLTGLLAIDLGDMGRQREARTAWSAARRAADASGDREMRVWTRGRSAQDAQWCGRPAEVVIGLADEAIEIADGNPSFGLARAHGARAAIAADQGDATGMEASLTALKRTFDRLPHDSLTWSPLTYQETQLRWDEGYARTQMGDGKAEKALDHALTLYPPEATSPVLNIHIMQATGLVQSRDVEGGLQKAIATLQDDGRTRRMAAGTTLLVGHLLRALPEQAQALPAARELRELASGRAVMA
ncbi:helix-turn-helix domain-containing protein [Actinomadura fibrosa]|uniref:Helix-turn-helix domain-containing protein n=1 Tax=Actinomadura fibrosa TaxID=111802 RepID=A0ABW2XMY5_9ACTN|nr:helix-turn-helix transcriptional regulator [Actinomadura fibrosa]